LGSVRNLQKLLSGVAATGELKDGVGESSEAKALSLCALFIGRGLRKGLIAWGFHDASQSKGFRSHKALDQANRNEIRRRSEETDEKAARLLTFLGPMAEQFL
jgi:hypothetical protein